MSAIPAQQGHAWPLPTDDVLFGFTDPSFNQMKAMRRDAVIQLLPYDGSYTTTDPGTQEQVTNEAYAAVASNETGGNSGVLVAAFTTAAERRTWIVNNMAQWLGTPTP